MQDSRVEFEQTLLTAVEAYSDRIDACPRGRAAFLPATLDDQEFRSVVMSHVPDSEAYSHMLTLATGCGDVKEVAVTHSLHKVDEARIAIAKLADAIAKSDGCVAIENEGDAETLQIGSALTSAFDDASKAVDRMENYLRQKVETGELQEQTANFEQMTDDARSMLRLYTSQMQSKWEAGLKHVISNLEKCIPEGWRDYTLVIRDDELIKQHIVANAELVHLLPRRNALLKSSELFDAATAKVKFAEAPKKPDTTDLLTESKLMVAVRAGVTVVFAKLPLCKNAKSRSATLRETKRLIGALEVEIPSQITKMMDEAAA